jgi:hypothetical protein
MIDICLSVHLWGNLAQPADVEQKSGLFFFRFVFVWFFWWNWGSLNDSVIILISDYVCSTGHQNSWQSSLWIPGLNLVADRAHGMKWNWTVFLRRWTSWPKYEAILHAVSFNCSDPRVERTLALCEWKLRRPQAWVFDTHPECQSKSGGYQRPVIVSSHFRGQEKAPQSSPGPGVEHWPFLLLKNIPWLPRIHSILSPPSLQTVHSSDLVCVCVWQRSGDLVNLYIYTYTYRKYKCQTKLW